MAISHFQHRTYPCPHCHIGHLRPKLAYYCAWHEGEFVSAPDFPAWVCDVCGQRQYDQEAVFELDTILSMDRSRRRQRRRQFHLQQAKPGLKFSNPGHSH